MLGHISTMLEALPSHIEQPVARLPMLTPAEHQQIVIDWNENPSPRIQSSVVEMFESQVARTPDATAVVSGGEELTYDQLNERANQLAHYLLTLGVRPETLVGISVRRSFDMIVGLFGILKAGAAYLPIDPAYPKARVTEILDDSCITILVTEKRVLADFDRIKPTVICLDSDCESIALHSRFNPAPISNPNNLAYVIYTSGSTGGPKGVLIENRCLAEYVDFAGREFDLTAEDRVLQFASSSFDTSAEEIFPTLARGATLVLRSDAMVSSISLFLERCREWGITVLDLPTAFWHELTLALEDQELSLPDSVRLVIIGGERAQTQRLAQWHNAVPSSVRLLNTYGPTEATIVTTLADLSVPAATNDVNIDVSVGRPVPGAKIFILDNHDQPVPPGVTGELHIGGAGLARGYLGRPELTAEKFIADPFSRDPRRRLYKTGDLGCYSYKGDIRISGRIDDQVKVNGYRIELSELERVLRSSRSVRDAVILVKDDPSGTKQLLAYVVPSRATESLSQEQLFNQLNAFLAKKLPRHMLPSAFLRLEELPVSANGKVDRTKLPAPHELRSSLETYARPRDPLERQLVEIWEELLNVGPIGIKDDFFELGGHSLLSVRMISRIEQLTGERLSLATLFEDATIEHLAARILKQEKLKKHSRIIKVKDGGARQPFFFFHGDFNGGGFYCLNLARGLSEDQPFYAVQPHGLDGNAIPVTIEAMAKAHLMELREIQPRGPYLLGGYCNGAVISFEIARLIEAEGEKVDLLVLLCVSVSNALRFRFLRNFVDCLSGVKNLEAEDRLNRFLTYRARLLRIREIKNYYRTRISDFFRLSARERLSFVREKSLTAGRNLVRCLVSIANVGAQDGKQESDDHNGVIDAHRERVTAAYAKAVLGYVPRHYHGRAVVLWPSELPLEEPEDPTAGWSKVAASVELLRVPGGHITCVTSHVEHVANALRVCLDEVANGSGYCVVQEGAEAEDQAERGCEKSYDTIAAFETVQNS
jgi:amino acid adenylation domain-containing protein